MDALYGEMFRRVSARREKEGSKGSFMDRVLDQQEKLNLTPNQLNFIGGVLMEGGLRYDFFDATGFHPRHGQMG